MSSLDPDTIRASFQLLRETSPTLVHALLNTLENRLLLDEATLDLYHGLGSLPDDAYSVRADRLLHLIEGGTP